MSNVENAPNGQDGNERFQHLFYSYLENLERRAHVQGLTLTDLCKQSKVSRATPDRWRKNLPKTIQNVCDLEAVVLKAEQRKQ